MLALALFAAAAVAVVGGAIWLGRTEARLRSERMAEACQGMGLAFRDAADQDELRNLADLPLFHRGRSRRARRLMTGRFGGRDVIFFDYEFTEDAGDDACTYRQSVALFRGTELPDFTLGPENILHRIASAFGAQDINFDASPEFSRAYRLSGPDETAIRRAFGAGALTFLASEKHWRVEVRGGTAGIWCHDRRCKPQEAELCLTELVHAIGVLANE